MADIYGSHFEFDGVSSRDYGLMIANIETDRFINSFGNVSGDFIFYKKPVKNYVVQNNYTDSPLTFDIEIISDTGEIIESGRRRSIEKWLLNKVNYRKLYIDTDDDTESEMSEIVNGSVKRLYFNCRLINPVKIEYNGGVVGYRCTLEADSPLLWQDPVTYNYTLSNSSESDTTTITVHVDTDIDEYTYPRVIIHTAGSGNVTIRNITDNEDRVTAFSDIEGDVYITMNGDLNYVSDGYYKKLQARNFVRLLDGDNSLVVSGKVDSMSIKFQNRRML